MPLIQLLLATAALTAGSTCWAMRLEASSTSRRLLLIGVLVPAQITALVLVVGAVLATFRPGVLLGAALAAGAVQVAVFVRWGGARTPWADRARRILGAARRNPACSAVTAVTAVAAALVGAQAVRAARIPVTSYDSLWYHLPEPSTWVQNGRVARSGLTLFGDGYPMGQEVLHGWTMVFVHSIRGTGLVPLWFAVVGALAVFRIARRLGAAAPQAAAGGAVFAAMPAVALQIGTAYVDLGAAAFGLAALSLLLDAVDSDAPWPLLTTASAAGALAIGAKPSMAPVVVACLAVAALVAHRRRRAGEPGVAVARRWAACAAVVLALGGCWYAANLVTHANPLYPVSALGFEGEGSFEQLVSADQAPGPIAGRALPAQVWRSWTEDLRVHPFADDQRLGGLGAVWLLACLPALVHLAWRLWRVDRLALAVLYGTAAVTVAASGSAWWSRYTLLLAGVGCAALATALDALRRAAPAPGRWSATSLAARGAPAAVAVLVAFSAGSAINPTDEVLVDGPTPTSLASAADLARIVRAGDGEQRLRPWGATGGLGAVPEGSTIAYVERVAITFPQVFIGVGLERRLVRIDPPPTPQALIDALLAAGADYLFLPAGTDVASVELVAAADTGRLAPASLEPVPGGQLWEVGSFEVCSDAALGLDIDRSGSATEATGTLEDGCGAVGGAPVEVWRSGTSGAGPWIGAEPVDLDATTDDQGRFRIAIDADGSSGTTYFARFTGRREGDRYRLPAASPVVGT